MKKIIVLIGLMFVAGFALAQSIEDQNTWEYAKGKSNDLNFMQLRSQQAPRSQFTWLQEKCFVQTHNELDQFKCLLHHTDPVNIGQTLFYAGFSESSGIYR